MWRYLILSLALFSFSAAKSQDFGLDKPGEIHGNFSILSQLYFEDSAISAVVPPEKVALQGFGNLIYTKGKFEAGVRFESYTPALVGYPAGASWDGTGIGYRYASYNGDKLEITVGNFYEQFGSGMVLRTWEDQGLGVDYSLDGIRVISRPHKGITLKGLYGKQRFNFENGLQNGSGIVRGLDAEISLNQLLDSVINFNGQWYLGGSFVSKFEEDRDPTYDYPENVGAASVRLKYLNGGFLFSGEYTRINQNPSQQNSAIVDFPDSISTTGLFQFGQGLNLNATYSTRGFGASITASSLSNMSYQSQRSAGPFDSWINYLPPTSVLNTYLLAQLYPYATQPNGEVAFRGDLFYKIPRNSGLGGKYGMKIDLSYTRIHAPDFPRVDGIGINRKGIEPVLFRPSDKVYYSDFNVKVTKKFNRKLKMSAFYMNLVYDNDVNAGAYDYNDDPAQGTIYADLLVFEGNIRVKRRNNLRIEAQFLRTDQHLQDWATMVLEYTWSPHWFASVINQYNFGNADGNEYNFPVISAGYIKESSRITVSYGRQRAGVFCVGGICRVVPASNGLSVSLTSSF
ncbi:MAG: hypothetical protein GVX78_06055 [Bacteroidetes bacterium]|jgi:hypothetical protein|nr:hypothetical protein [Bacteroidota bacterium]